jgi:tetratricopeptide (TPR) repeat protein
MMPPEADITPPPARRSREGGGDRVEAELTAAERWEELVAHHVEAAGVADDPRERARALLKASAVFEARLGDAERAAITAAAAHAEDYTNDEAARELERLASAVGRFRDMVAEHEQQVAAVASIPQRIALLVRLGRWHEKFLDDAPTGKARLQAALALDPGSLTAARALAELETRLGDPARGLAHLVSAAAATARPTDKVRLYLEAATTARARLNDAAKAAALYARALEHEPDNGVAMEALAELAVAGKDWGRALPLLERLAQGAAQRPPEEVGRLHQRAFEAALALGDGERARGHGRRAFELDPTAVAFAKDFADTAFDRRWWEDAAALYETLLARPDSGLGEAARLDATARLGRALTAAGRPEAALPRLEAALATASGHRGCREAAVEACIARGEAGAALHHQKALLTLVGQGEERFDVLVAMARRCRDDLGDKASAATLLQRALDIKPDDRPVLHELLDLHIEAKEWKRAVDLLRKLGEAESGAVRAKYFVAAANILHYELHSSDEAVELYERVLDEDPEDLKTFERIDKILTSKRAWRDEARSYRRMLKRLGPAPTTERKPTFLMLWRGLGEIYRTRLQDLAAAAAAFEVSAQLAPPDDGTDQEILAEIFETAGGDAWPKAVEKRSLLLERASTVEEVVRHIRCLRRLYQDAGRWDRTFAACAALVAVGQADARERELYERLAGVPLPMPRAAVSEEMWRKLLAHADEDARLSALLGTLAPLVSYVRAKEAKRYGLRDRNRLDLDHDPSTLARLCAVGSQLLGVARPAVYVLPDVRGELDLANVAEEGRPTPTFVVGADLLARQSQRELAFVIGRRLACLRPAYLLLEPHVVGSREELKTIVLAVLKLFQPAARFAEESDPTFQQYLTLFQRSLPPHALEPLSTVVPALLESGSRLDLGAWRRGAERTTHRVGLLLAGDVNLAARLLRESLPPDQASEAVADLVRWSVSPAFMQLREQVGLGAIGPGFQPHPAPSHPKIVYR